MSFNHLQPSQFNRGGPHHPSHSATTHSLPTSPQGGHQFQSYSYGLPSSDPTAQPSSPLSNFDQDFELVPEQPDFEFLPHIISPSSSFGSTSSVSSVPFSSNSSQPEDIPSFEEELFDPAIEDSVVTIRAGPSSSGQSDASQISLYNQQTFQSELPYDVRLLGFPGEWRVDIAIKPIIELSKKSSGISGTTCDYTALRLPMGARTRSTNNHVHPNLRILDLSAEVYCAKDLTTPVIPCDKCRSRVFRKRTQQTSASSNNDDSVPIIEFLGSPLIEISNGQARLRFAINCYCRHHAEDEGFRIKFTLCQHNRRMIGQVLTDPIRMIDNRKPKGTPESGYNPGIEPATPSTVAESDVGMDLGDIDRPMGGILPPGSTLPPSSSNMSPSLHPTDIDHNFQPIKQQRGRSWNEDWFFPPPSAPRQVPKSPVRISEDTMYALNGHDDPLQQPSANPSNVDPQIRGLIPSGGHAFLHGVNFHRLYLGGFWIAFGNVYYRIDDTTTSRSGPLQILDENLIRCVIPPGTPSTTVAVKLLKGATLQTLEAITGAATYYEYAPNTVSNNHQGMPSSVTASFPSNLHPSQFPSPFHQ